MVKFYVHRIKTLGITLEEYEELKGRIADRWRNDVIAALNEEEKEEENE